MTAVEQILEKTEIELSDIPALLAADEEDCAALFRKALAVKRNVVGNRVYLRGLIEYSNYCTKNCFYCGIRSANSRNARYEMTEGEVLEAARYAWQHRFGSIVLQSGERDDEAFVSKIEQLIGRIQEMARHELHITLSLGEQRRETYGRWFQAGAHRYLLRVEDANSELYRKLHPSDARHAYEGRVQALRDLRAIGYQVGTGVMIGLPFQTIRDLAEDLIFFRENDIDMVGMGPYIEHKDTPLYEYRGDLLPLSERLRLSLKMVAVLRILMKDINIAATTALQAIDPIGREMALQAGANVIMPNLTPLRYRQDYLLYENKPCLDEETPESVQDLANRIRMAGDTIAFGEWGDSKHFEKRKSKG